VCILGDSSVIRYSYNVLYYFLPIYYEIIHEDINAGAIPEGVHFSELESETESYKASSNECNMLVQHHQTLLDGPVR
jgi:hypothetical protein